MKKIKRILALALALTLCLGLAATVFAALPSYDVIASRMSMSDSLNENDDILVAGNLKWIWYLDIEKSAKNTSELHYRRAINDDTKMTVSNLSPADCSDVLFVYVVALGKDNDGSYVSVETDANGNPVRQFAYTVSGWKTVAPSGNFSHTNITSEYYGIPAGKEVSFTCAELRALIDSSIENPMFLINVFMPLRTEIMDMISARFRRYLHMKQITNSRLNSRVKNMRNLPIPATPSPTFRQMPIITMPFSGRLTKTSLPARARLRSRPVQPARADRS